MAIVTKQSYRAYQSPYESNLADPPVVDYTGRTINDGGFPFRLGRLKMEITGRLGAIIDRAVNYALALQDFTKFMGLTLGGLEVVGANMIGFYSVRDEMTDLDIDIKTSTVVRLNFEDYFPKHPDLRSPYEVTVVMEYIQKCPEVEAIADEKVRRRIYDDLALSGLYMMEIDTDKYLSDPSYSLAQETARQLNSEANPFQHNYIEPFIQVPLPIQPTPTKPAPTP